ncbi:uncharacterized protein B0T23DRAFT_398001 [Neurospora hispaniola]|uniref:Ecp2 effector protein domain-containing protein n=1 Tax=Neurospora hispaniola TaxID=588809 RepID=A0AAJ0I4T4_9PEZI|nr:hypothetical protein B0T23DRAFT_398001 [Neurospora hispaniola]
MFSSLVLSGALLAIFQTIPTTLAFPTFNSNSPTPSSYDIPSSDYTIQDDLPHPSFNITTATEEEDPATIAGGGIIEARAVKNSREVIRVDCDIGGGSSSSSTKWGYALAKYVAAGVKHLKEVSGTPSNGPGPGNCGRAPRVGKELSSYGEIAWAAQEVQKRCYSQGQSTGTPANINNNGGYLKGAVYMRDQWSVIVRSDHDNC